MTKRKTKTLSKAYAVRRLREAKATSAKAAAKPAKPKAPTKKPVKPAKPVKSFADLRKAMPATPRPDKLRADTIALNLLMWDTAELEGAKVAAIASSYRETGTQISRITIRPAGKGFRVVAGRHRCEAAKAVGWTELKYELLPYLTAADKLTAELIEIDENLCRKNLSPATEAALTARRKAIYEKLHPVTAHGGDRKSSRQIGNLIPSDDADTETTPSRFTEATATTAGRSERSVQRAASRGEAIGAHDLTRIAHTSLDKGDELDALAKLEPAERKDVIARAAAGEKVSAKTQLKKQKRNEREQTLGGLQLALPTKQYGVIVEDFEWDYEVRNRDTGLDRHASNHYETAADAHTPEEIVARTKDRFACAADDCALFMWAPGPHLAIALDVLRLRGFKYVSHYVWNKDRIITGWWARYRHELLLIGVKGKPPCPAPGTQLDSVIDAKLGRHSAKPECFLEMIEQYFPTLPKIELNRRGPARPGWDAWGNEAAPAMVIAGPIDFDQSVMALDASIPGAMPTELEALETIDNERPLTGPMLDSLKAAKLVRGSVKLRLTKAGMARLTELRKATVWVADGEQSPLGATRADADRGGADHVVEKIILVDCRVCADGNGICAQCLPAEGHTVRHTNPNGEAIAECNCGWSFTMAWGGHHAIQDAAIKAHWQSVVDEARAAHEAPSAAPELEGDGLDIPGFLRREPAEAV